MKFKGSIVMVAQHPREIEVHAHIKQVDVSEEAVATVEMYGPRKVTFIVIDDEDARETFRIGRDVTITLEVGRG